MTTRETAKRGFVLSLVVLAIGGGCAAGGPGDDGSAVARIASSSAKADGEEGAAYWDVYVDDQSMTWVGTDGTHEDRLFFHADGETIWLDVDRDGLPLGTLGVATSGDVVAMPDDAALYEVGQLLDEAFRDSDAVALEAAKADVIAPPPACAEEESLTVGQVLRVCAASFGAVWRVSTGRGYEDQGGWGVLSFLADLVTPLACTGGLASLFNAPGSLTRYCENPGQLQITSATLTCASPGSPTCNLNVQVGATGNLPAEVVDSDWPRIEVFGPDGSKVGWGFATKGAGTTWSDDVMVWDIEPNATYQVVVTSDFMVRTESTVRLAP